MRKMILFLFNVKQSHEQTTFADVVFSLHLLAKIGFNIAQVEQKRVCI